MAVAPEVRTVTLLSNASQDAYPSNIISRFRSRLDLQLDRDKSWEAALHSVSYVKSYLNFVHDETYTITYYCSEYPERLAVTNTILPGQYSQEGFVRRCVIKPIASKPPEPASLKKHKEATLFWDANAFRFVIEFSKEMLTGSQLQNLKVGNHLYDRVGLSADLARKLGFGEPEEGEEEVVFRWDNGEMTQRYVSTLPVLFQPVDALMVQCSLIQPTHAVGPDRFSVLAVVPVGSGEWGTRQVYTPVRPLFFDVNMAEADFPTTILTSLDGKLVHFTFGVVAVTLVVREKQAGYHYTSG